MDNSEKEKTGFKEKKLYRSKRDRMIAGVCGGLGEYFDVDPLLFRIAFVLLVFGSGFGILLYIILALIVPNEPGNNAAQEAKEIGQTIKENVNEIASEFKSGRNTKSLRTIFGILIVAIGAFLLLGNLFPQFVRWDLFWPLALILVGFLIISKRR